MRSATNVQKLILKLGIDGSWVTPDTICSCAVTKGAYALCIQLERDLSLSHPKKLSGAYSPGTYVYCGNANGPGGVRSRLNYHFRRTKKPHWHIDYLTTVARAPILAFATSGPSECDLIALFLQTNAFEIPCRGFGSSDCRSCVSHLLKLSEPSSI